MFRRVVIVATAVVALAACGGGSDLSVQKDSGSESGSALSECIVGDWVATEEADRIILKVTDYPDASITGSATVTFSADGGIAYTFDNLTSDTLSTGAPGTKTIDGTIDGTFTLSGDRMSTTVTSSRVTIEVDGKSQTSTNVKPSDTTVTCSGNTLTLNNVDDGQPAVYRRS